MSSEAPAFKIKTGNLPVLQLHIFTTDMAQLKQELALRLTQTPDFFASTPIVMELAAIAGLDAVPNFAELTAFMRKHGMCPAGVSGGSELQRAAAAQSGLGLFPATPVRVVARRVTDLTPVEMVEAQGGTELLQTQPELPGLSEEITAEEITAEEITAEEITAEVTVQPPSVEVLAHAVAPVQVVVRPTMVIDKPVRTGQSIYAEGANLVLLAIANAGSELIADGDIHVYAPLRGKAIAGAHGNESARIFVHKLEAELLSIAGCFKVFEDGVPEDVRGKAAQIHLEGNRLVIEALPG